MESLAYCATPYTKFPGGLNAAFEAAAALTARLRAAGIFVYSPIVHCHPLALYGKLDPLDLSLWYPHNELMMDRCNVLLVAHLPSWEDSIGIQYEIEFFEKAFKPIFDLDPYRLKMTKRGGKGESRADFALWEAGV